MQIVPAPAGLVSGAPPQPNGVLWVLSRKGAAATLHELQLPAGTSRRVLGVSGLARSAAQSSTGALALGLARGTAGAVELLGGHVASRRAIPLPGPVRDLAFGDDGVTLYALDGSARTRNVAVIDTSTRHVRRTIGLPSDAAAIVPTPSQRAIWSVQRSGTLQETSLTTGRPIESFAVNGKGIAIAIAPRGQTLYVLKGTSSVANVATVTVSTETQTATRPAAAHSVGLTTSLDGSELYDFVGTSAYGNIQIIRP